MALATYLEFNFYALANSNKYNQFGYPISHTCERYTTLAVISGVGGTKKDNFTKSTIVLAGFVAYNSRGALGIDVKGGLWGPDVIMETLGTLL